MQIQSAILNIPQPKCRYFILMRAIPGDGDATHLY